MSFWRTSRNLLGLLFIFTGLYFLFAFGLCFFPSGSVEIKSPRIKIFVISNGFHTDILLPIKSNQIDWIERLGHPFLKKFQDFNFISFGWGDKNFYIDSFSSDYPSMISIFKALFLPTDTLMHVDFYKTLSLREDYQVEILISDEQYEKLIQYIMESIKWNKDDTSEIFSKIGYRDTDIFLVANGYYHLFYTCNNWTNAGLKRIGAPASIWCPFAYCILAPFKK